MKTAIITGSAGLVGAAAARHFAAEGYRIVGIDNNLRQTFFGPDGSTDWSRRQLEAELPNYRHVAIDIRSASEVADMFREHRAHIRVIIHTAAQPSHDWAAKDPHTDFTVNANGTLTLLETARQFCPEAPFIFTSTNKVYGDRPNSLPLVELETRWELPPDHPYYAHGIDEQMSLDQTQHSLFGVSKVAADLMVQEYGRYFGLPTVCFRGGCLTGPGHSPVALHGFLAYLMKCAITGDTYRVFGYAGKQVRDNIDARDLVQMFWQYHLAPRPAAVYNAGGGRRSHCSLREAATLCEEIAGRPLALEYVEQNRIGDHIWWVSDVRRFEQDYPAWKPRFGLREILTEIHASLRERLAGAGQNH